jgi:hypothetical protein
MNDENILPVVNPKFNKTPQIHPLESFYLPRFSSSPESPNNTWGIYFCCILPLLLIALFVLLFLRII